jgi:hypothetical protein
MICLPHLEISEILEESKHNLLLADYARILVFLCFIILFVSLLTVKYLQNEVVRKNKLNTELVLLFNKIQEDKIATSGQDKNSDVYSDSDESI